jgi:hypothetical protein
MGPNRCHGHLPPPDDPLNIKWVTLNNLINTEKKRLESKGIFGGLIYNEIYHNLDFYKIDDKIKAENIKKYRENKKIILEYRERSDDNGSTKKKQPPVDWDAVALYNKALVLYDYYERWFIYHDIDRKEWDFLY